MCDLIPDWRGLACEGGVWRGLVREATTELNQQLEASEARKKDEIKKRREGSDQTEQSQSPFLCNVLGCAFVGQNKAGLVNHIRQRHGVMAQARVRCSHCGELFHKQGVVMHQRYCQHNPARQKRARRRV